MTMATKFHTEESTMTNCTGKPFPENEKYLVFRDGSIVGPSGKVLKPRPNQQGYMRFQAKVDGKCKDFYVHRAVCFAFVGPPPSEKHQVDHINNVRSDNRADNLRWVTKSENLAHRRLPIGEDNWNCKLTDADVRAIRKAEGSHSKIAKIYDVARETIRDIKSGKARKHV